MSRLVCPWWIGILMVSPIRKWFEDPDSMLGSWIRPGMTILEPGPGMGFFTLPMARMVGATGKVIAVDLQAKMLSGLRWRAERAGLLDRIQLRQAKSDSLGIEDLSSTVHLIVAIHVVHEMPSDRGFFQQAARALIPGGRLLLIEPRGHVTAAKFSQELQSAAAAGLTSCEGVAGSRGSMAILAKP